MTTPYVPLECPACSAALIWSDTNIDLLCTNILCPAKILSRIEHFCRCMGIEEMSATTLEKLNLSSIEDLYELTHEYIETLDGFGSRKAEIVCFQIKNSLISVMPVKFIEACGIPGIGEKGSEAIYRTLRGNSVAEKLEHFFNISSTELQFINGIGKLTSMKIIDILPNIRSLYAFLINKGLVFKETDYISTKFLNVNIALTGSSPDGRKRDELEKLLKLHGAIIGSVSSKTNILIAENPMGNSSKLKTARKYGIQIVSYEEFFKDL